LRHCCGVQFSFFSWPYIQTANSKKRGNNLKELKCFINEVLVMEERLFFKMGNP